MEFELLQETKKSKQLCSKHNIPLVEFRDHAPFCSECQREQLQEQEQKRVLEAKEKDHRRKTCDALQKDSIVGDATLWGASFDNYIPDNTETNEALLLARRFAYEYLDRKKQFNTIFTGAPGSGKSHLAMSMLKAVNDNFEPWGSCLFISINDLLRLIKDSFNQPKSKYTEANMVELLSKTELLVLDDLGSEASFKRENREASEYVQQFLFGVLNARNRTIITTNLNSSELEEIYNPKIISRIYRGVEGHIIKFTEKTKDKRSKITF